MTDLDFLRQHVSRLRHQEWFNTQPRLTHISVAEHCFMTAAIVSLLLKDVQGSKYTVEAALFHDLEEGFTGDVSALAKRLDGEVKEVWKRLKVTVMNETVKPPDDVMAFWKIGQINPVVKAADLLSMWIYAMEEVEMGNESIRYVCFVVERWLEELITDELPQLRNTVLRQVIHDNRRRGINKDCVPPEYLPLL